MHGNHSLKPHNATHRSQQVPLISFVHARSWNLDTPEVFYELPDPLLDSARHSDVKYHKLTIKVLPCSASFFWPKVLLHEFGHCAGRFECLVQAKSDILVQYSNLSEWCQRVCQPDG